MRFNFDRFFIIASVVMITLTVILLLDLLGDSNPIKLMFNGFSGVEYVKIEGSSGGGIS